MPNSRQLSGITDQQYGNLKNKYPIYVITYKRWETRKTVRALELDNLPFYLIVDGEDYESYAEVVDNKKILKLPEKYRKEYDCFWNDGGITGSGPARNFAWDHAEKLGTEKYWLMDDNIDGFQRLHKNRKLDIQANIALRIMEDFTDRYENVALSGPNYDYFCPAGASVPSFVANARVFSCILIKTDIPYRWRGRYNEDVDLNLRVMKDGLCTIQFNAILQLKAPTQTVKGGNNKAIYEIEGTYLKSKMIWEMHPDVCKVVWRFKRHHHYVDYSSFKKNKLIKKKGLIIDKKTNNYGMIMKKFPRA